MHRLLIWVFLFVGTTQLSAQSTLESVNAIRRHCDAINATAWTQRRVVELTDSEEGGFADFYFHNDELTKITVRTFNEAAHRVEEFYLQDSKLIQVYEKGVRYDRSVADSTTLEATAEPFLPILTAPERFEQRSYFKDSQLLRTYPQMPSTTLLREEGDRLLARYAYLLQAVQNG